VALGEVSVIVIVARSVITAKIMRAGIVNAAIQVLHWIASSTKRGDLSSVDPHPQSVVSRRKRCVTRADNVIPC